VDVFPAFDGAGAAAPGLPCRREHLCHILCPRMAADEQDANEQKFFGSFFQKRTASLSCLS
jgi:hypothetical protein